MGIWRFAGAFAVVERQSECGSKNCGMHVSQPMTHRRVLGVVFYPQPSFSLFMSKSFGTGMVLIKLIQSISSCFIEKP